MEWETQLLKIKKIKINVYLNGGEMKKRECDVGEWH